MNIEDFPSIQKVKKAIENLKQVEFPKFDEGIPVEVYVESVTQILLSEFGFLFNPKQSIACNKFIKSFFRVRALESFSNIDLVREHSYPPFESVKMGRCNFPKYPVFYCSNNPGTALLEVARTHNFSPIKYCVSKWELIQSNQKLIFESFLQIPLPDKNYFNLIRNNVENRINEPFEKSYNKKLEREQEEGILEYLRYLDSSFIKDKDYSISATLAHRTLYARHNFKTDILMYPSVQSLKNGVNLVIRPTFVDNNLKLKRLYILSLNKFEPIEGEINVLISKYGEVNKNNIIWRNIDPEDKRYRKILEQDFGKAYNSVFKNTNLA